MEIDFEKSCLNRKGRAVGYVVLYNGLKEEKVWNYFKNMKKLVRFLKQMQRRGKDFKVYSCLDKCEMTQDRLEGVLEVVNYQKKGRCLFLDT